MVTFETKVYENDWEYLLKGSCLERRIEACNYDFREKRLFINNVSDRKKVTKYAEKKVSKGVIDSFYLVEDYADQALDFFGIHKNSFEGGYYYSISELVSIYLCETEYLLHFSSDSFIEECEVNWIDKSIELFNKRDDIVVANPTWNYDYLEAERESTHEIGDFYLGQGFSDQCYLARMDVFKGQIYNQTHPDSERFPKYGGELFEKRVDGYMRNNNLYRITSKHISYLHKNFPKKGYSKILFRLFGKY